LGSPGDDIQITFPSTESPYSLLSAVKQKEDSTLRSPVCEECHRFWQEYASATTEHIRLDSKLRLAALSHEHELIPSLTQEVETAGALRESTREAIRKHEATHAEDAAAD
jgi:hypothetical protein